MKKLLQSASCYIFITLTLVTTLIIGCSKKEQSDKQMVKNRPAPVIAAKVQERTIPLDIQGIGNVEPYSSVVIKTQVGGMITEQFVRDGQTVSKGDLLFTLDQRPFEAALKEAKARLERDQALLIKAQEDMSRYNRLIEKNVITKEQQEQVQSNTRALQATIRLDEAGIEKARLDIEYASIKAQISGRIGSVMVNQGNVVKANDDRSLLTINQVEPIYVSFSVSERYLPSIRKYSSEKKLEIQVIIEGDETTPEPGELAAIDNTVDKSTGMIKLKGLFANTSGRLWPGQFVRVSLKLADINGALLVPSQAIQTGINGQFVFVVKSDSTVEVRSVKGGKIMDKETVVESGLSVGETVVTDGQVLLTPGKMVEIKKLS